MERVQFIAVTAIGTRAVTPSGAQGTELLRNLQRAASATQEILNSSDAKRASYELARTRDGEIHDLYTGSAHRDGSRGAEELNIEHIWPRSGGLKGSEASWDLHNLVPTHNRVNSIRANYQFSDVINVEFDSSDKYGPRSSLMGTDDDGDRAFEPDDAVKGDVARAVMYMAMRWGGGAYKLDATKAWDDIDLMLSWHEADPPDESERIRNEGVQARQGNLNPFVSEPALAARIGAAGFRQWVGARH